MFVSHWFAAATRVYTLRRPAYEATDARIAEWIPRQLKSTALICMVAFFVPGCAEPEPPKLESARAEVRRVLEIWKDGKFYVGGSFGKGAKSMEGYDIDRFFPILNMYEYRLKDYEILEGSERKPGEYTFKVSQTVYAWAGPASMLPSKERRQTHTRNYVVTHIRRNRWMVVDAWIDAQSR